MRCTFALAIHTALVLIQIAATSIPPDFYTTSIQWFSNLERLALKGNRLSDETFVFFGKLKSTLKFLMLTKTTGYSKEALQHLGELECLEELRMSGCHMIDSQSIGFISRLTALTKLRLSFIPHLSEACFAYFKPLTKLERYVTTLIYSK